MKLSFKRNLSSLDIFAILTFLLLAVCIFDPASLLLGLKTPLFALILFLLIIKIIIDKNLEIPGNLFIYISLFSVILPTISLITVHILFLGDRNSLNLITGFYKTSLFLLLSLVFFKTKTAYISSLAFLLTLLAVATICLYILTINGNYAVLQNFGTKYKIFNISINYFFNLEIIRSYFWTSPMLVFSLNYYTYCFITKNQKVKYFLLLIIIITGMLLSGSRSNIVISFISFFAVLYVYQTKKNRVFLKFAGSLLIITLIIIFSKTLIAFFGTQTDEIRYAMMKEYWNMYVSDIRLFLFGQGLGSEVFFQTRGEVMSYTELTYFELFRKFGFIFGLVYLGLMMYPIRYLSKISPQYRWLLVTYVLYLIMAFFNPFYFSSNGIIILAIVLYAIGDSESGKKIVFTFKKKLNV